MAAAVAGTMSTLASVATFVPTCRVTAVRSSSVSIAKAFGLKTQSMGRVTCMASYQVTIKNGETGEVSSFECPDDEYILDAAEELGITLPCSCRSGACSSCAGLLQQGSVDQSEQSFLDDSQVGAGYVLTCVAYPTSDCIIVSHQEQALA
ncbi:uncharacterized protein [Physcomitrium patens]|uniref:Ferredoxin n=1 Tax=Physcomitrium patens TaxID=3218 RepID=A9TZ70_PHYPA|nr:uncharacterized protein LOC112288074 [Physcomitrium patens]PNR46871.1 hypothetical protein PHYPA_013991 [Physcomitrium patens]|eukprot:XP_024387672.1 uncharacterized protein LOC112288074 [Physcomitrella patens]